MKKKKDKALILMARPLEKIVKNDFFLVPKEPPSERK